MSTALAEKDNGVSAEAMEKVLVGGDLARLTSAERLNYYGAICKSVGLNALTRPFEYITLNGKLTLYARKDCTEQLRRIHGVSIFKLEPSLQDDVFLVAVFGRDKTGREDSATGAVTVAGLKGEAKANAMMKAETKAKRRLTLSLCGLGMLDETEVETIPTAVVGELPQKSDDIKRNEVKAWVSGDLFTAAERDQVSIALGKVKTSEEMDRIHGRTLEAMNTRRDKRDAEAREHDFGIQDDEIPRPPAKRPSTKRTGDMKPVGEIIQTTAEEITGADIKFDI